MNTQAVENAKRAQVMLTTSRSSSKRTSATGSMPHISAVTSDRIRPITTDHPVEYRANPGACGVHRSRIGKPWQAVLELGVVGVARFENHRSVWLVTTRGKRCLVPTTGGARHHTRRAGIGNVVAVIV